jgi:RNA polymerase sigma factor (sigma-70 family)
MRSLDGFREIAFETASNIVGEGNAGDIISELEDFLLSTRGEVEQGLVIAKTKEFANERLQEATSLAFQRASCIVSKPDADDIAQDVVIKYIRQPGIESWKGWILDVAKKDALNKWKSWHNRLEHFDDDQRPVPSNEQPDQPDLGLLRDERKFLIGKTLEWMKERNEEWYIVFCMTQFEEMSRKEIAQALSRSENSIKGIEQRATDAFRCQWLIYKKDLE